MLILLSDEEPGAVPPLARRLEEAGHCVVTATGPDDVLELARSCSPAAFVLGAAALGPATWQVCAALRRDPRFGAAPLVLVSAAAVGPEERRLVASVGASLLGSPADADAVLATLTGAAHHALQRSVLGEVAEGLLGSGGREPDLRAILERCLDASGTAAGALFLVERAGLTRVTHVGLSDADASRLAGALDGPTSLEAAFARDEVTMRPAGGLLPTSAATERLLLLPLARGGARVGLLAALAPAPPSAGQLAALGAAAGPLAQAVALAALFARLSESDARFHQVADGIEEVLMILDVVEQTVRYVNPAYEALWGRSIDALSRDWTSWLEGVHAGDRDGVREAFVGGLLGQGFAPLFRVVRPDGTLRWVRFRSAQIEDAGRALRLVAVAADVTELKQAVDRQEQAARLATFSAQVGAALTQVDDLADALRRCAEAAVEYVHAAGARVWLRDAAGRALTLKASAGVAPRPEEVVPVGEGRIGRVAAELRSCLTNDAPAELDPEDRAWALREGVVASADYALQVGGRLVGVLSIRARSPIDEEAFRKVAVAADMISVAVRREEEEVARRALEAQLGQAQKMEAVGRLAGGVAHDFNNLLTVILGFSQLALSALRPEDPLRRNLEQIEKAANRATSLTRQLLVFSRHEPMERKVLDVNAIVTELERMLVRLVGEDLELRVVLGPGLGRVHADAGQVEQVVVNLCVNARDAMPRGGRLTIETANVELDEGARGVRGPVKAGRYVMLAVSDSGTGIPPEVLAHLFEPFFTTKPAGKGTGLGLSTVYGIVTRCGGAISVYTEVGRGTTFKVYLPRHEASLEAQAVAVAAGPRRGGTETVLLVEDDRALRELTQGLLRSRGYRVLVAENGGSAILAVERHAGPIDLVLTDVVMPGMSGRELVDRLGALRPGLRSLYMSGYTAGVVLHDDVTRSGAAFLQKPFTAEALARKVREVLDASTAP